MRGDPRGGGGDRLRGFRLLRGVGGDPLSLDSETDREKRLSGMREFEGGLLSRGAFGDRRLCLFELPLSEKARSARGGQGGGNGIPPREIGKEARRVK